VKRFVAFFILWAAEATALVYVGAPVQFSVILAGLASAATVLADRLNMLIP
jgi:hypothetical protein